MKLIDEYRYVIDFGSYEGKPLSDVPAWYLLWLWNNNKLEGQNRKALKEWIEFNLEDIRLEDMKRKAQKK